jgi:hypothetical protein
MDIIIVVVVIIIIITAITLFSFFAPVQVECFF